LCEHECFPTFGVQTFDQVPDCEIAVDLGRCRGSKINDSGFDTAATLAATNFVEAYVAGDTEDPSPDLVVGREAVERPNHPHENLLTEIVCRLEVDEVPAGSPDIGLNKPQEAFQRHPVAVAGLQCRAQEKIHVLTLTRQSGTGIIR
jgi:hypothetical protein